MNLANAMPVTRTPVQDARSCEQWLARAALADSRQACSAFVSLLDEIEDARPGDAAYVEILERLRRPIRATLYEQTRRFSGRPLPLSPAEEAAFAQARDLWLALLRAWQNLQRAAIDNASLDFARALTALRAVQSAAGLIEVHFAARREIGAGMWRWLHESYVHAERNHLAETDVPQSGGEATSCAAAYCETLLMHLAHPCGLGHRELAWVQRWAHKWSYKVKLWRSAENGGGPAVDLEGDAGPQWTAAGVPGASIRFIDCSEIGRSIRKRVKKLEQGLHPAELGLGRDCTRPAVDQLLKTMARCWSDLQQLREFPRRPVCSSAQLAAGIDDIYRSIAEKAFDDGDSPWKYSRLAAEQIHVFQRALDCERTRNCAVECETWKTVDESANGFQLLREGAGCRIAIRQLIALRPEGAGKFILCEVRWLKQSRNGALSVGVRALPGLPQACALRTLEQESGRARAWVPAFLLPIAFNVAPTLAVPVGAYSNRCEAELKLEDKVLKIRFGGLLRHGHDFDWVDFAAA